MSNQTTNSGQNNSYVTTFLIALVLLMVLYFAGKACTNHKVETAPTKHPAAMMEGLKPVYQVA